MILGIGVDLCSISAIVRLLEDEKLQGSFAAHTFTPREIAAAANRPDPAAYYASRFAAKEAVFKAVAPLTKEKGFDLRLVEVLNAPDGSPYVSMTDALTPILQSAGIGRLHISLTDEGDYALAFVVAEKRK